MSHLTRENEFEEEERKRKEEYERKRKEEMDDYYSSCSPLFAGMDYVKDVEENEKWMKIF